ncbi:MAG: DUF4281 domain-containing protein [Bdellovibrionales bacterium]|nr:DUF4281 domain-containing protein [Bdellovibrionales bacterium]
MKTEVLFQFANVTAILGWAFLILGNSWSRRWPSMQPAIISLGIALALSLAYGIGALFHLSPADLAQMNRLEGLQNFFARPGTALLGWVHFLAIDLAIGAWISMDSKKENVAPWLISPILALTFLFGPLGFALYFAVRKVRGLKTKS